MSATASMATVQTAQLALSVVQTLLGLTAYQFPATCSPKNLTSYDYIIVGAGTAGSVIASRLTENRNINVLLVEAGGYMPLEAELPGGFTLLPLSEHDYNYTSVNDHYTAQNMKDSVVGMTQGRMVGGSSALNHLIYVQGNSHDFEEWAHISGDDAWNYENILPYYVKMEQLFDQEILNSTYAQYHGTSGYLKVSRELSPTNVNYLNAFKELGHRVMLDASGEASLGYNEPLYNIGDGKRQSSGLVYLGPAKDRDNLCMALHTKATKIVIENNVATGVQMVDSSGNTLIINASKEVIVCAGAIGTPQLLMLSGIGPKSDLEALGIEVKADKPVGENFQDHTTVVSVYQMEASTATTPAANPHVYPVPTTTGYVALDPSQTYADYQIINMVFPHDSTAMLQLCASVFQYTDEICNLWSKASAGRSTLFVINNLMKPKSRGKVKLVNADYTVPPAVYTGAFSNSSDLTLMARALEDYHRVMDTMYYKSVNATLVDVGLCSNAESKSEFWKCYAIALSSTLWHYGGTCAMGYVLDSALKVTDIDGLRVADSSAMPTLPGANINAAVTVLAEKAADMILADWNQLSKAQNPQKTSACHQ